MIISKNFKPLFNLIVSGILLVAMANCGGDEIKDGIRTYKDPQHIRYVNSRDGLILREKPDPKSQRVALLPYGSWVGPHAEEVKEVEIGKKKGRWIQVSTAQGWGWVFGPFLAHSLEMDKDLTNYHQAILGEAVLAEEVPSILTVFGRDLPNFAFKDPYYGEDLKCPQAYENLLFTKNFILRSLLCEGMLNKHEVCEIESISTGGTKERRTIFFQCSTSQPATHYIDLIRDDTKPDDYFEKYLYAEYRNGEVSRGENWLLITFHQSETGYVATVHPEWDGGKFSNCEGACEFRMRP